jgi:hypothetical protein
LNDAGANIATEHGVKSFEHPDWREMCGTLKAGLIRRTMNGHEINIYLLLFQMNHCAASD